MKKFLLLTVLSLASLFAFAQAPNAITYQGIAADNSGAELTLQDISLRYSVRQGTPTGGVVWQETHQTSTDEFGLFILEVGTGTRSGGTITDFANFPWEAGPFFLEVELDASGGLDFDFIGISPITSVPYSIFAEKAGRAAFTDSSAVSGTSYTAIRAMTADTAGVSLTSLSAANDNDTDPTNELQTLTFNNGEIGLSGGNSIFLDLDDADADPENEIQNLVVNGTQIGITGGNTIDMASVSFGGAGASSDFPQGIVGEYKVYDGAQNTVPPGKTLYITAAGPSITIKGIGASGSVEHNNAPNMPILPSGTIFENCNCTALLVDNQPFAEAIIVNLNAPTPTYTVPPGKIFFVKSGITNSNTAYLNVNGREMEFLRPNFTRSTRILAFPSGTLIRKSVTNSMELYLTGYLIDAP